MQTDDSYELPELVEQRGIGVSDRFRRLWTPHRLAYVKGEVAAGEGCPFCSVPRLPDEDALIVARGESVYAVLNIHPYNPGHLMVVPYRHVGELEDLQDYELTEFMEYTTRAVRATKKAFAPHAFNIGLNLGAVAGGSLSDHLHQHVVPRWSGDTNFIAIVGMTKVIPQLLSDTRAELAGSWTGPEGKGR